MKSSENIEVAYSETITLEHIDDQPSEESNAVIIQVGGATEINEKVGNWKARNAFKIFLFKYPFYRKLILNILKSSRNGGA